MKIDIFFTKGIIQKGDEIYSPLFGYVKYKEVRPFSPMENNSAEVIACEDVLGNTVLFDKDGKAFVWQPSGEMYYSTTVGECMLFPKKNMSWEDLVERLQQIVNNNN